jgi:predicted amidophosphoribosyltransferase
MRSGAMISSLPREDLCAWCDRPLRESPRHYRTCKNCGAPKPDRALLIAMIAEDGPEFLWK